MSVTQERPGVYSSYDVSSVIYGGNGARVVGLAAGAAKGEAGAVTLISSAAQGEELYGAGSPLARLAAIALGNGAYAVAACPAAVGSDVPTAEGYSAAFEALEKEASVELVACGSGEAAVHQALKESVERCAQSRRERIAIVAPAAGETVSQLVSRAAALNSERMVLVAPAQVDSQGQAEDCGALAAAAVAGAIAAESDPAIPLGGAALSGLAGLEAIYSDSELDLLIRGGVTPLECVGGQVEVVRGITTRTTTGGAADATWRELSTILIVDDVIPAVRESLRARFTRVKNTAQTRQAIASQVTLILEEKRSREIIESYDSISVTQDAESPTVCIVEFHFGVAHGLNQIHIAAHITI